MIEVSVGFVHELKLLGQVILLFVEYFALALQILLLLVCLVHLGLAPLLLLNLFIFFLAEFLGTELYGFQVCLVHALDARCFLPRPLHLRLSLLYLLRLTLGTRQLLMHHHDLTVFLLHDFTNVEFAVAHFAYVTARHVGVVIGGDLLRVQ